MFTFSDACSDRNVMYVQLMSDM